MNFLLDTDTCSFHLRKQGILSSRFLQYMGRLHVSVLTAGELFTWTLRANAPPARLQSLIDLLDDVQVIDVDLAIARRFGELRAALLDAGRPTPTIDLLIAATAIVHGMALVTHNTRDFSHIPGLLLADWLAP
ncbi:MAG TPA: type II toxin-antitoxin system VapC family toxin [Pirellulales bacterium]|nr:type II toxin-antitoxin system VapC family toxin [Pirellulales bacterium]